MITVRAITHEDMPTLERWAKRRGCLLLPAFLSPHGFLATKDDQPLMCCWAYMLLDVPVIELDHVFLPPRFKREDAREAWSRLIKVIEDWIQLVNQSARLEYRFIKISMNAALAKEAERSGAIVGTIPLLNCLYLIHDHGS